jgi:hypothetical protein
LSKQKSRLRAGALASLIGAAALLPTLAEAKTECRTVVGIATAPVKDEARDKARQNAIQTAQATMGAGIAQATGGWVGCGYSETGGVTTNWECKVEVNYCTTEVRVPQPSLPGYTPPPTFKPPL